LFCERLKNKKKKRVLSISLDNHKLGAKESLKEKGVCQSRVEPLKEKVLIASMPQNPPGREWGT